MPTEAFLSSFIYIFHPWKAQLLAANSGSREGHGLNNVKKGLHTTKDNFDKRCRDGETERMETRIEIEIEMEEKEKGRGNSFSDNIARRHAYT